jgi:hypothetical protein
MAVVVANQLNMKPGFWQAFSYVSRFRIVASGRKDFHFLFPESQEDCKGLISELMRPATKKRFTNSN